MLRVEMSNHPWAVPDIPAQALGREPSDNSSLSQVYEVYKFWNKYGLAMAYERCMKDKKCMKDRNMKDKNELF